MNKLATSIRKAIANVAAKTTVKATVIGGPSATGKAALCTTCANETYCGTEK